jgi:hypothetical protein
LGRAAETPEGDEAMSDDIDIRWEAVSQTETDAIVLFDDRPLRWWERFVPQRWRRSRLIAFWQREKPATKPAGVTKR